ncbi:unnamed protein product, partial [Mesorhabditis belari]|uniref:Uncharacterized protein n=1 Tax=Mesorhabditis belari TaxID=2138241 RepID=A0AAF3EVB2_9BILA
MNMTMMRLATILTDDAIELVRKLEEPQIEDATMKKDSVIVEGTSSDCFRRVIEIVGSQYTLETTCQQDGYENWQSVSMWRVNEMQAVMPSLCWFSAMHVLSTIVNAKL